MIDYNNNDDDSLLNALILSATDDFVDLDGVQFIPYYCAENLQWLTKTKFRKDRDMQLYTRL